MAGGGWNGPSRGDPLERTTVASSISCALGIVAVVAPVVIAVLLALAAGDLTANVVGNWAPCAIVAAIPAIAGIIAAIYARKRDHRRLRIRVGAVTCSVALALAIIALPAAMLSGSSLPSWWPFANPFQAGPPEVPATVVTDGEGTGDALARIHFIDVGQADATFVEFADGTCLLVDAGTRVAVPKVVAYVQALGHARIDHLVATHPHEDHIGGMVAVLDDFDVSRVWAPRVDTTSDTYFDFLEAVQREGLAIDAAASGKVMAEGDGYSVRIVSPEAGSTFEDLNDYSAILLIQVGQTSCLLCADASAQSIRDAAARVKAITGTTETTVLKVGHHGSASSTNEELARLLSPEVAVISCGANNDYGMPAQTVLDALGDVGALVLSTEANGDVVVGVSDGQVSVDASREGTVHAGTPLLHDANAVETVVLDATGGLATQAEDVEAGDPTSTGNPSDVVYVTATGTKYHLRDCETLERSTTLTAVTLEQAQALGYGACGVCGPPGLE